MENKNINCDNCDCLEQEELNQGGGVKSYPCLGKKNTDLLEDKLNSIKYPSLSDESQKALDKMSEIMIQQERTNQYQEFFNMMNQEYGLTLTISEMDEIIHEAMKVTVSLGEPSDGKLCTEITDECTGECGWCK